MALYLDPLRAACAFERAALDKSPVVPEWLGRWLEELSKLVAVVAAAASGPVGGPSSVPPASQAEFEEEAIRRLLCGLLGVQWELWQHEAAVGSSRAWLGAARRRFSP